MNAELMPSETGPEASPSRPSPVRDPDSRLSGWWDPPSGRLGIGGTSRTPELAARSLDSTARSVGHAREFAADAARGWGLAGLEEDLRLVVSELVGNACRHAVPEGADPARSPVLVQLRRVGADSVVCMVADDADTAPQQVDAHQFAECGRGLGLVAAFGAEWGWSPINGGGKVVWVLCTDAREA
ncbi:ATP-binding protein [Nocardiopsis sp. HNM0947]|uniref:ATP-binding protein n=1 Tax=Nocardiopsis coralli TaxID=2772213 RepID=A0ABR9PBD1_9ACTN|nr:ATP-binding protein [Nocardiopsis coralli]MBE3001141.1 ATP-binding protein [Nocardiopsis coralli]